jgi:glutathione S-transferase
MIKIHHLNFSAAERIVWLCEELQLPYEIQRYTRDPVTISPPDLKALHPMGAAPVIEDGELMLAESGAIVDYLIEKHGGGRLRLPATHPDFADFIYWFHYANGTLQPLIVRIILMSRAGVPDDNPLMLSMRIRLEKVMAFVELQLGKAPYLGGRELTAADIMSVFVLTTMRRFLPIDLAPYPNTRGYLQRIGERSAYQRAITAADPGATPILC